MSFAANLAFGLCALISSGDLFALPLLACQVTKTGYINRADIGEHSRWDKTQSDKTPSVDVFLETEPHALRLNEVKFPCWREAPEEAFILAYQDDVAVYAEAHFSFGGENHTISLSMFVNEESASESLRLENFPIGGSDRYDFELTCRQI